MTQDTPAVQDSLEEAVDNAVEEISERREQEKQRHQRKMNEIEEHEEEVMQDLHEQAGLPDVSDRHRELIGEAKEIKSIIKDVRSRVFGVISDNLSGGYPDVGGYNSGITVKNGRVYKYNKQRNPEISFKSLVDGGYRDSIEEALQKGAPDVADEVIHAFETINGLSDGFSPWWSTDRSIEPVTRVKESSFRDKEYRYDTLRVYYTTNPSSSHGYGYIELKVENEDSVGRGDNWRTDPGDTDAETIKLLGQVTDDLPPVMDDVEQQMAETREAWETIRQRVDEDLPGGDDE